MEECIDYFGVCPICRKNDGYINIGRGHWFFCEEHKVRWYIGSNLFSSWQEETKEEQREIFDKLEFGNYQDVEPIRADFGPPPEEEMIAATPAEIPPWADDDNEEDDDLTAFKKLAQQV